MLGCQAKECSPDLPQDSPSLKEAASSTTGWCGCQPRGLGQAWGMQLAPAHQLPKEHPPSQLHSRIQMAPGPQGDRAYCSPLPEKTSAGKPVIFLSTVTCSKISHQMRYAKNLPGTFSRWDQTLNTVGVGLERGKGPGVVRPGLELWVKVLRSKDG